MYYYRFVFVLFLFFQFQTSFALKPDTTSYAYSPSIYGLIYKDISPKTVDAYTLSAWFYPAQEVLAEDSMRYYFNNRLEHRPYEASKGKKPTIIICDGDASNLSRLPFSLAFHYSTQGFNVITFDWRGFGESQAFPTDTNMLVYTEYIKDYNAVIDYAITMEEVDADKIGVYGFSAGAFLSFGIATERKEVKAIAGRGIFTDYKSTVRRLILNDPNDTYIIPDGIDQYSPRENWNHFSKPIFLIVGEDDTTTPKEESIEIISKVQSEVRELWIVKGAKHGGASAPEILNSEEFTNKIVRFFNENL